MDFYERLLEEGKWENKLHNDDIKVAVKMVSILN